MFLGKVKRVLSIFLTTMMLTNLMPAVCYAENIDEVFTETDYVSETAAEYESIAETCDGTEEEANAVATEDEMEAASTTETETTTESETETTMEVVTETETEVEKMYLLTADEYEDKVRLAEVVDSYYEATEGVDYRKGIVFNVVDSREKAEEIADLYDAELIEYELHVALYKLSENMSVKDALALAADLSSFYPVVYPDLIGESADVTECPEFEQVGGLDYMMERKMKRLNLNRI